MEEADHAPGCVEEYRAYGEIPAIIRRIGEYESALDHTKDKLLAHRSVYVCLANLI